MDNRQVAEAFAVETGAAVEAAGIVSEVEETSSPERYPNRFKPGKSGNPAGRPKKSREEEALLEQLKHLTPMALEQMEKMLKSERVAALAKVRIIEIILERTFGKVESAVKVTSTQESVEAAQAELEAIFASWDDGGDASVPVAGGDLQ